MSNNLVLVFSENSNGVPMKSLSLVTHARPILQNHLHQKSKFVEGLIHKGMVSASLKAVFLGKPFRH